MNWAWTKRYQSLRWLGAGVALGFTLGNPAADAQATPCQAGDRELSLPETAAVYSNESLLEGAPSPARAGQSLCVDSSTFLRGERRTSESPIEPIRVYSPEDPETSLTVRREYITSALAPPSQTPQAPLGRRDPASVRTASPEATRPRVIDRSQLSQLDPSPFCGGATVLPLPPRLPPSATNPSLPSSPVTGIEIPNSPSGPDEYDPTETVDLPRAPSAGALPTDIIPHIERLSAQEGRREFYDSLLERRDRLRSAAQADTRQLQSNYQESPLQELETRFERARDSLAEQSQIIETGKSKLSPGEQIRFSRQLQSASERAELARRFTQSLQDRVKQENERASLAGENPVLNFLLLPNKSRNPLARSADLELLFGKNADAASATTSDGLAQRLVLLEGLPSDLRQKALQQLALSEPVSFQLPSGAKVELPLLHNGYILGGGRTGLDCSSFVSAALPADIRKGTFTTWDFRTMWTYRRTGTPPRDPRYEHQRLSHVLETSKAFDALDLYQGDEPAIGDLLVHRLPWEVNGHVFVVREWHRDSQIASVIEASQSAGTIREREFPLSLDPPGRGSTRLIRPGLLLLRIRPVEQRVCAFRKAADRGPASMPRAGPEITPTSSGSLSEPYRGGAD